MPALRRKERVSTGVTNAPLPLRTGSMHGRARLQPFQRTGVLNVGDTALANCAYKKPKELSQSSKGPRTLHMSPSVTMTATAASRRQLLMHSRPQSSPIRRTSFAPRATVCSTPPAWETPPPSTRTAGASRRSTASSRRRAQSAGPASSRRSAAPSARAPTSARSGGGATARAEELQTTMLRQSRVFAVPDATASAPDANRLPQQYSHGDLREVRRKINLAHKSFDLDGDGVVSQEEYVLSKQLDQTGTGVLTARTLAKGRKALARQFFERNEERGLWMLGEDYRGRRPEELAERLTSSAHFSSDYQRLTQKERRVINRASNTMQSCMSDPALARPPVDGRLSRKALVDERRRRDRHEAELKIERSWSKLPQYSLGRVACLTDFARENS